MAHVLVPGASKGVGLEIVKAALAAGHRVRAFARSASGIATSGGELERFMGDARDAGNVVILALGVPVRDLFGSVPLFSDATNLLVPAMERAGVDRLIAVTGFGAGDGRDAMYLVGQIAKPSHAGRAVVLVG